MLFDSKEFSEIKHERTILEPSLEGGYSATYHNRIPIDIKYVDYDRNVKQIGGAEMALVKLYSLGSKGNSTKVKLEIQSEYDPFFNLNFECDAEKYRYLHQQQGLQSDFQEFATILIKCFNKVQEQCCCRAGQSQNQGIKGKMVINLLVGSDGKAKLIINQSSQFKNIEVVSLDLSPENEENVQQKVAHRYQEIKKKVEQAEQKLAKIQQIIKLKNPTLLTQIFKNSGTPNQGKFNVLHS